MSLCVMGAKFVRCLVLSRRLSSDFDILAAISLQWCFSTPTNHFKSVEDQQQSLLLVLKIRQSAIFGERNCGCARDYPQHHVCEVEVTSDVVVEMDELPCQKFKLFV